MIEKKDPINTNGISKKGKKSKRNKSNSQTGNSNASKRKDGNDTVQSGAD